MLTYTKAAGWYVRPFTKWLYPRLRRLPLGPKWIAGPVLVIITSVLALFLALLLALLFGMIAAAVGSNEGDPHAVVLIITICLLVNLVTAPLFSGIQMASMVLREGQAHTGDLKIKTVSRDQYLAGMERWEQRLADLENKVHAWSEEVIENRHEIEMAELTGDVSFMSRLSHVPKCVLEGRGFAPWEDCPSPHLCPVHSPQIERDMDDASCLIIDNWEDRNIVRQPLGDTFPSVPLTGKAARGLGVLIVEVVPWVVGVIATWYTVTALVDARVIDILDGTMLAPDTITQDLTMLVRVIFVFLFLGGPFIAASVIAYMERGRRRREGVRGSLVLGFVATLCLWIALAMVMQSLTIMPALGEGRSSSFNFDPPQFMWWRFFLMTAGALFVAHLSEARWGERENDAVTVSMMSPAQ